jgi:hypothetical protein
MSAVSGDTTFNDCCRCASGGCVMPCPQLDGANIDTENLRYERVLGKRLFPNKVT